MCGIAFRHGDPPSPGRCRAALASIAHRGPDAQGVFEDPGIFMCHTRLKIVDLSNAADQPMHSPDGRYVLAYNGEIYNHAELRSSATRAGWKWRSHGDTESLLALLVVEGPQCLRRLRGMFAFVLWDRQENSLLAARDTLGIKPLYYSHKDDVTTVASELHALTTMGVDATLDSEAVTEFLLTGSVHCPRTIFSRMRCLPPGHYLTVRDGRAAELAYWRLPDPLPSGVDSQSKVDLVDRLDLHLADSVKRHLCSDVPVATFLSGGIDSSLITAYASEHSPSLKTFCVGFETRSPERWDEKSFARIVSDRYGTDHTDVVVTRGEFANCMEEIVGAIDQPSADGVNSYFVARAAAAEVKVALSGQGGDELFAGYNVFRFVARIQAALRTTSHFPAAVTSQGRRVIRLPASLQHNWYIRAASTLLTGGDIPTLMATVGALFGPGEIGAPVPQPVLAHAPDGDRINAICRHLIVNYLPNTLLRDLDVMSMAHSLEVRVPLTDSVLAEFALGIAGEAKVTWQESKVLLRAIARRRLPAALTERRKQGFTFPLCEWLQHPTCQEQLKDVLSPASVRNVGLVDPKLVAGELKRLGSRATPTPDWLTAQRVWALYVLHQWHQQSTGSLTMPRAICSRGE
ncbi:MAG: asparagine synthase (glutamine-hydrolyzing) [Candidatus Dormibacteraeota bacterium]|nr:asparagine synthase (glutamine-hydrolyzing) [Candidatus Dormibacteraeota bacterium]